MATGPGGPCDPGAPSEPQCQEEALFGAAIKAFSSFQENAAISREMMWRTGDGGEQRR